jgi:hypothetical protein
MFQAKNFFATGFTFFLFCIITTRKRTNKNHTSYLSDPGQSLDRVDPVATADNSTATSMRVYQTTPAISIDATTTGYSASPAQPHLLFHILQVPRTTG